MESHESSHGCKTSLLQGLWWTCLRTVAGAGGAVGAAAVNNIRRRLASGRMSDGAESLVQLDNVVRHAKASE